MYAICITEPLGVSWDFWDSEPRSVSDLGDFNLGFWWQQPGILVSKNLG